ncbi:MAG: DedA family protein, partial [Nitrospirales bacterium]|nr:DedA family protein [Nitrospirales bacterium]
MEFLKDFFEIILHLDGYLSSIIGQYGGWTYAILFLIIFCETGLVVTPFLPGDSLLFTAGALAAITPLELAWLIPCLITATIAGDNTNYWIGYFVGPGIFSKESSRLLNREHLARTHRFYERHGGKTIVLARFAPIVRTFAPFVAGVGRMGYPRFLLFSVGGGISWIMIFVLGGYFFGNIPVVNKTFTLVFMAIHLQLALSPPPGATASRALLHRGPTLFFSLLFAVCFWVNTRRVAG